MDSTLKKGIFAGLIVLVASKMLEQRRGVAASSAIAPDLPGDHPVGHADFGDTSASKIGALTLLEQTRAPGDTYLGSGGVGAQQEQEKRITQTPPVDYEALEREATPPAPADNLGPNASSYGTPIAYEPARVQSGELVRITRVQSLVAVAMGIISTEPPPGQDALLYTNNYRAMVTDPRYAALLSQAEQKLASDYEALVSSLPNPDLDIGG